MSTFDAVCDAIFAMGSSYDGPVPTIEELIDRFDLPSPPAADFDCVQYVRERDEWFDTDSPYRGRAYYANWTEARYRSAVFFSMYLATINIKDLPRWPPDRHRAAQAVVSLLRGDAQGARFMWGQTSAARTQFSPAAEAAALAKVRGVAA